MLLSFSEQAALPAMPATFQLLALVSEHCHNLYCDESVLLPNVCELPIHEVLR